MSCDDFGKKSRRYRPFNAVVKQLGKILEKVVLTPKDSPFSRGKKAIQSLRYEG